MQCSDSAEGLRIEVRSQPIETTIWFDSNLISASNNIFENYILYNYIVVIFRSSYLYVLLGSKIQNSYFESRMSRAVMRLRSFDWLAYYHGCRILADRLKFRTGDFQLLPWIPLNLINQRFFNKELTSYDSTFLEVCQFLSFSQTSLDYLSGARSMSHQLLPLN